MRIAGLSLTGILAAQLANAVVDIPYSVGTSQTAVTWMFGVMVGLFMLGLGLLSTQSTFKELSLARRLRFLLAPTVASMHPDERAPLDWTDPVEGAQVTGFEMWGLHSILHRLRRLHLSFGVAVLSLVAARVVDDTAAGSAAIGVAGLAMVTVALTSGPTADNRLVLWGAAIAPSAALAAAAWSVISLATGDIEPAILTVADDVTFEVALLLGVAAGSALIGEMAISRGRSGFVPVGLLAVAALIGGTLGLTTAMLTEITLSDQPNTANTFDGGASYVTMGMLGLVVTIALTTVLLMMRRDETGDRTRVTLQIRNAVLRSRGILTVAAIYGLVVGTTAVALSCGGPDPGCAQSNIALPDWVNESSANTVVLLGLPFDPASALGWAKLLMVAVPAVLISRSIIGGLLNGQDSRRQVGILWDLGSFWPRWFHPLAPPAYGPYAVTRLQTIINQEKPDVLAAHSQGSLIASVALSLVDGDTPPGLFISYGSQIGDLYPKLFPSVGLRKLITTTDSQLGGSWINLWRASDPIGGQVIPEISSRNWKVETGTGHSRYELTPEFCAARKARFSGSFFLPRYIEISNCWDDP